MNTIMWAIEQFSFDGPDLEDAFLELIGPAQYGGVVIIEKFYRQIYDGSQVEALIAADTGRPPNDVAEIASAITQCDGKCPGCIANDGSGCWAVALFYGYTAETGLPKPPRKS